MEKRMWAVEHDRIKVTESVDMPGMKWDKTVEWEKKRMIGDAGIGYDGYDGNHDYAGFTALAPDYGDGSPETALAVYEPNDLSVIEYTSLPIGELGTEYSFALDFLARINIKYKTPLFSERDIEEIATKVAAL